MCNAWPWLFVGYIDVIMLNRAEYGDEVTIVSVSQTTNKLSNKAFKLTLYLVEEKWDAIVS